MGFVHGHYNMKTIINYIIINYIKSCFCSHNWEKIATQDYVESQDKLPYKRVIIWRCVKCGRVQKVRL